MTKENSIDDTIKSSGIKKKCFMNSYFFWSNESDYKHIQRHTYFLDLVLVASNGNYMNLMSPVIIIIVYLNHNTTTTYNSWMEGSRSHWLHFYTILTQSYTDGFNSYCFLNTRCFISQLPTRDDATRFCLNFAAIFALTPRKFLLIQKHFYHFLLNT